MFEASSPSLGWAMAYKLSEALFYLEENGILHMIADRGTIPGLSSLDHLAPTAALSLEKIFCAAGLFVRREAGISLSPDLKKSLPFLAMERYLRNWHRKQDSLEHALHGGAPRDPLDDIDDPVFLDHYIKAMALNADIMSLNLIRICRPFTFRNILDLGGANGSFAVAMLKRIPKGRVTVFDRPCMTSHVERTAHHHCLSDRMEFIAGDLNQLDPIKDIIRKSDLVTLMNIIHLFPMDGIKNMIETLYCHMSPGRQICVFDHFIDPDAPFNICHLLALDWINCASHFSLSADDFILLLHRAGFQDCQTHATKHGSFILGTRTT